MSFTFFRKYNKLILAVGGSILMVLFLIPQLGQSGGGGGASEQEIGTLDGKTITNVDRQSAYTEMRFLMTLNPMLAPQEVQPGSGVFDPRFLPGGQNAELEWMLMVAEARQQGLYASKIECTSQLEAWGIGENRLKQVRLEFGANDQFVNQAMRHYLMVAGLKGLVYNSAVPSEPELRRTAQDLHAKIDIDFVAVKAGWFTDSVDEPTEQQLQEKFDEYRANYPGTSEPYGFGYVLPRRVKYETLSVPLDRAKEHVTVEETEAYDYYKQNPKQFLPSLLLTDETSGSLLDESGRLKEQPDPKPYDEVREEIIDQLKTQKATDLQQRMLKSATATLTEGIRGWQRDENGFPTPIDAEGNPIPTSQWASFEAIQQSLQQEFGPLPDVQRVDRWVALTDLSQEEGGIGRTRLFHSGQAFDTDDYISTAQEFDPPSNPLRLHVGAPSLIVEDDRGTKYLFRLSGAEADREPDNLDEVRDRVTADLKRLTAFNDLTDRADELVATAREKDLVELADSLGNDAQVASDDGVTRRVYFQGQFFPRPIDGVGLSSDFVDQLFDKATPALAAKSLDEVPAEDRFFAIPVEANQTVYIIQITKTDPMTAERYSGVRTDMISALQVSEFGLAAGSRTNPFSFEALSERLGYVQIEIDEEEGDVAEAESDDEQTENS